MIKTKANMITHIITAIVVLVALITATYAWYSGESLNYTVDLIADSVFSIYFSTADVDVEGTLVPAVAMEGAIAAGKHMDVTKTYDESDPEPSWVSQTAGQITYWTKILFRGVSAITISYDWFVSLVDDPTYFVDNSQFVMDVDFFKEQQEIEKTGNKLTIQPTQDESTTVIDVRVKMYFAYVDELVEPVLKNKDIYATIDITRIFNLEKNQNLNISFDTASTKAKGELTPAVAMPGAVEGGKYMDVRVEYIPGNDDDPLQSWIETVARPVRYSTDIVYTGSTNYLIDYTWGVSLEEEMLDSSLFLLDVVFKDQSGTLIVPNANGYINLPASSTVTIYIYVYYAIVEEVMEENYSQLLGADFNVLIRLIPGV